MRQGSKLPYLLNDLHVPHTLVGSNSWPVWELLVSSSFNIEAVRKSAQLETISIWKVDTREAEIKEMKEKVWLEAVVECAKY